MKEEWKKIRGYGGRYSVSDRGRVRRDLWGPFTHAGRILKPFKWGWQACAVSLCDGERRLIRPVPYLVLETFVGRRPSPKHMALHWDDNQHNNRLKNLRWGTKSENARDMLRNRPDYGAKHSVTMKKVFSRRRKHAA